MLEKASLIFLISNLVLSKRDIAKIRKFVKSVLNEINPAYKEVLNISRALSKESEIISTEVDFSTNFLSEERLDFISKNESFEHN